MTLVQCSICLEQFTGQSEEDIYATKCGHIFHNSCIVPWIKRSKNCPECRVSLTTRGIFKLYLMCEKQSSQKVNSSSTYEKRLAVETRFLEESNEKLQKENTMLKIQLGEATSESLTLKSQLEEAKSESTQLKADLKKANLKVKKNTTTNDSDDYYDDEHSSEPKAKRAKSNWSSNFVSPPPPSPWPRNFASPVGYGYTGFADPMMAERIQRQLKNGKQKMMNAARAEIRLGLTSLNGWL